MRAFRVVWAVVGVLGVAAALFVPVIALPVLGCATACARRHSRGKLVVRRGRFGLGAAAGPLVVLAAIAGTAAFSLPEPDWNLFGPYDAWDPSPQPWRPPWWSLAPVEHLVLHDPFYAGVALPALLIAVPVALAAAVGIALSDGREWWAARDSNP